MQTSDQDRKARRRATAAMTKCACGNVARFGETQCGRCASEQSIRKACEEAGCGEEELEYVLSHTRGAFPQAILALARRIEAEAVPVAWLYTHPDGRGTAMTDRIDKMFERFGREEGWTETPLYAAPPKEPTT